MKHDSAVRPSPGSSPGLRSLVPLLTFALVALIATACGGRQAAHGGPPAMPVEVVTLAERPVEQTTEFVGIVKSRRSATVQPQVEGFVTRILVRSGARVAPGAALLEIDPRMQEAAVSSLESLLAVRKADLQQARQQAARMKTLLEAGASSQAEMEQAETALATTEAQANAIEAQLREQRVALAYHTVSAPTAGIVGDIPVRVGDRVTKSTLLTTIDESAGLEIYINVPVQEAVNLRVGLPVRLVDDRGQVLATERLSYVSASVEGATQSVLAKATLESAEGLRTEQIVRARIIWSESPALTVPIVALNRTRRPVLRLRGRDRRGRGDRRPPAGRGAGARGRQRLRRQVGPEAGREADRVRRAEDRRRRAGDASSPPEQLRARPRRRRQPARAASRVLRGLHPPADPRDGLLADHHPGGSDLHPAAADRPLPGAHAAVGHDHRLLHRRQRAGGRERGHDADRAGGERGRGHDVHRSPRAPTAGSRRSTSSSRSVATPTWPRSTCRTGSTR